MQPRNGCHDRQAQAESTALAGLRAMETLEHQAALRLGYARPGILHRDAGRAVFHPRRQLHAAALRCEPDRIVEQVADRFEQQATITHHARQIGVQLQQQHLPFLLRQRCIEGVDLLQQRGRRQHAEPGTTLVILQLGDPQQRAEACHQGICLLQYLLQRQRLWITVGHLLAHAVQLRTHARQRGAQVVGDVVAYPFDLGHQLLDAVEHGVDDGRQHVQFIAPVGQRQALAEVAGHDLRGRLFDGLDASQRPPSQQVPAQQPRHQGQ
ncbi:hypothetical protein G6F31_016780 [Rhizopus arrhizus]|nr:hypothetical protein G6F31_016780 [Rhizopus arrhizus]